MRISTIFMSALALGSALPVLAQDANSNEARLRDALRAVTLQLQTAEAERAALQAGQTALEQKAKASAEQVSALTKQLAADKDAADRTIAAANTKATAQQVEIERLNASLEKWKTGFEKTADIAKKTEAERVKLAANVATLTNRTADLERKNLALFKIGSEILERYENFSFGTALAAREPFIGNTRVRLENQVQGYRDRLVDPKLKP